MLNFKLTGLTLSMALALINSSASADETATLPTLHAQSEITTPEAEVEFSVPEEQSIDLQQPEEAAPATTSAPRVSAKFYSAEVIQAIPRLKVLAAKEPEHNKIIFRLDNFPKHKEINIDIRRLASKDPAAFEHKVSFTIDDDGSFLINNTDYRLQNLIGSSHGYLPGERVVYRFSTADGTISKEISGVPTPAVVKNKDHKVVLRANLVSLNPTVYQIILPGMADGEEYEFKSTSIGETTKAKPKYSKKKPLLYTPSASRGSGGEAILEVKKKSGTYSIRLPWGTALDAYHNEKKIYNPKP